MSRFASPKTAQIWVERMAQCEPSNAPVAQFCQSIGCSPTSCYQWQRTLAAKPQISVFLRVSTSGPTKDSIEIKPPEAGEKLEASGNSQVAGGRRSGWLWRVNFLSSIRKSPGTEKRSWPLYDHNEPA